MIFTSLVLSFLRSLTYPSTKIKALDLLIALGSQLSDDLVLDRIVPYVCTLIDDENASVRDYALKALTQVVFY